MNDSTLQSFMRVNVGDASLLGAPIFPGPGLDNACSDLCEALDRTGDRLSAWGQFPGRAYLVEVVPQRFKGAASYITILTMCVSSITSVV